jgi:hypothetical protein
MTNIAFCIIAPFCHRRLNGMAANIGSLAPELDEPVVGLGIERKASIFLGALTFHCRNA